MNSIILTPIDLSIAAGLVLGLAGIGLVHNLGISKPLLIAAIRTTLQLSLIGFVLKALFSHANLAWMGLIAMVMLLVAGREVLARQQRRFKGWWSFTMGTGSLFIASFSVTLLALLTIINIHPWYDPQYTIPLLGMILGNTMSAVALSLDRLTQSVWQQRTTIEQRLMLGQERHEAIFDIRLDSIRTGMLPIINAMATAGLVNLPGMMTGQILAGTPPVEAVKYQILILFLIAASSGFGIIMAITLASRRLFDERHRLRIDTLQVKN